MINSCVSIVHETTSKLELCDLVDLVICWCRKHRQILSTVLALTSMTFLPCGPPRICAVDGGIGCSRALGGPPYGCEERVPQQDT
jgi:hypothetical protein